ncbi:MAG: GspE/PulE family protein [Myxococcota bacterium]|nr:GspE/PulE family protein [Myxococcota bacterium]
MTDRDPDLLLAEWLRAERGHTEGLDTARELARESRVSLLEALCEGRGVDERRLYLHMAKALGIELGDAETVLTVLDPNVMRSVPAGYQERKRLVPLARQDGTLIVASCDPQPRLLDLCDALDCRHARLLLVTPTDLRRLRFACDLGQIHGGGIRTSLPAPDLLDRHARTDSRHAGLLDALLVDAVAERASDIHLERYSERVRVRLRIDGDLHDVERYRLSPSEVAGVTNVAKVRSGLDIAERRRAQGGRFSARIAGQQFDLRVQTLPSLHGEGLVIRLLPQDRQQFALEALGFSSELEERFRKTLSRPAGLVLVVGPTGSGKTTTLYAGLQQLASDPRRKVVTVEDPIEYAIEGVQQTQINEAVDYAFAGAVRSFVRTDPDVIFVGEIRDPETALEAARASQTGHLVLSTLHASDTVDAAQRLFDLGLHPNSIAAELREVFAQRLVRRICPACREPDEDAAPRLAELFPKGVPDGVTSYRGRGCDRCRGRGSFGRIAVAESLSSTRELRLAIAHHRPLDELREIAESSGLHPLRRHALQLLGDGIVSAEDLMRVFPPEMLAASD